MKSLIERFEAKIYYSIDNCWYWTGSLNIFGYGMLSVTSKEKVRGAHRVSYEIFKGKIPKGLNVLHSCDNRACVNPDHLSLGTQQDNMDDMQRKGRRVTLIGERCHNSKLNESQVREILSMKGKMRVPEMVKKYGVIHQTIYQILNRKTWTHLT